MNKIIFVLPAFLMIAVIPAFAANGMGASDASPQVQQQLKTSPTPSGYEIQNQNQIKTQNQGEDSNIQEEAMEQENQGAGQNASANMSVVAEKVRELQQLRTTGGIGDQVRQVARVQVQAHNQIREQIEKLDAKGKFARLLTGSDLEAVENLKAQVEQNLLRIGQLEELKTQLSNQGDAILVQETIDALIQESSSLQNRVEAEQKTKSLFGWLFKMFK